MKNRRLFVVPALLLALLGGTVTLSLVASATSLPVNAQPTPTKSVPYPEPCPAELVHYHANAAGKEGPRSFGLSAENDLAIDAGGELLHRLCGNTVIGGDPTLFVAHMVVVDGWDANRRLTHGDWQVRVRDYVERRIQWRQVELRTYEAFAPHYTLFMDPGYPPTIGASRLPARAKTSTYLVVPVLRSDGTTMELWLRLRCGFQPMVKSKLELPVALSGTLP